MTACQCRIGRLSPLGAREELALPWLGVAVLKYDWEEYGEARAPGQWIHHVPALLAMSHSVVHFMQALGCTTMHDHGLRMINAAQAVVAAPQDAEAAAWFREQAGFLDARDDSGLSRWELMEAAAGVEALRCYPQVGFTSRPSHGPAYERIAERLGPDDADELCSLLTFVALLTDTPGQILLQLAAAAAREPDAWKQKRAADLLDALDMGEWLDGYWDEISAGEPMNSPYIIDPLRAAMRRLGRSLLLEALARPSAFLNELEEPDLRSLFPPVMVFPSRVSGVGQHLNGVAQEDEAFARNALADAALFGAASQLALAVEPAYCGHEGCPHRPSGLCRTWFAPPDAHAGHDACDFIRVFSHHAGAEPAAVWSRHGG